MAMVDASLDATNLLARSTQSEAIELIDHLEATAIGTPPCVLRYEDGEALYNRYINNEQGLADLFWEPPAPALDASFAEVEAEVEARTRRTIQSLIGYLVLEHTEISTFTLENIIIEILGLSKAQRATVTTIGNWIIQEIVAIHEQLQTPDQVQYYPPTLTWHEIAEARGENVDHEERDMDAA